MSVTKNKQRNRDLDAFFTLQKIDTHATCQRTYRSIVGRNMLRAFGHRVAMCFSLVSVVGSSLTIFKLEPTTPKTSQHVATGWPDAPNMLSPIMLRYVAMVCCDRLSWAIKVSSSEKTKVDKKHFTHSYPVEYRENICHQHMEN